MLGCDDDTCAYDDESDSDMETELGVEEDDNSNQISSKSKKRPRPRFQQRRTPLQLATNVGSIEANGARFLDHLLNIQRGQPVQIRDVVDLYMKPICRFPPELLITRAGIMGQFGRY